MREIKSILHFSLLWNLFEYTYFDDKQHLDVPKLLELAEAANHNLCDTDADSIFGYFQNRYFHKSNFDKTKFKSLGLTLKNAKFCQTALSGNSITRLDKVKCIFLIIHRFRNNLFHGRKEPKWLNLYKEPFTRINIFLTYFLDTTSDNIKINKYRFN